MISPAAVISLRDDIVHFCTMISKLRLGYGIFKYSATACIARIHQASTRAELRFEFLSVLF